MVALMARTRTVRHEGAPLDPADGLLLVGRAEHRAWVVEVARPVVLGRDPPDDGIALEDDSVSRLHAELDLRPEGVRIRDLKSKNGTRVNGRSVDEAALVAGDRLELGTVCIDVIRATPARLARARRRAQAWRELSRLTPREHEVARCVAAGLTSGEIATQLDISTRTVNTHLERIFDRLEIRSRMVLARLVIESDDDPAT